jgi:glutamine synthetase
MGMTTAGMIVESVKGECNFGQHEIAFKYSDALSNCDNHVIYKNGAKEIADQQGYALTFMAKPNEKEGNSSHIHLSFRGLKGELVMVDDSDKEHGMSELGRQFIAGQLAHLRELSILLAPNINSYKRYVPGSFAPTAIRWGRDNRTCALRLVGHGAGLRLENRVPGGDVNPYLAVAGIIAAGLDGIKNKLKLEPAFTGNAYESDSSRVPASMPEALELWEKSEWIKQTFGAEVQAHYANMARVEIAAYGKAVTDWELFRNFERF